MGFICRIGLLAAVLWCAGAESTRADDKPVVIFAAASLTSVLSDVAAMAVDAGLPPCRCVHAASSALARQIVHGAPADIFISANRQWMDYTIKERTIDAESLRIIARNRLVLISPAVAPIKLPERHWPALPASLNNGWLAMGDPDHVPAGQYALAALKSLGLWDRLAPRIARAANVRAALALVARGEAAAGIVYGSDLQVSENVLLAAEFPADSHPPIEYPAALTREQPNSDAARYYTFLFSPAVQARFRKHGFLAAHGS